jgi:hypothetical protein
LIDMNSSPVLPTLRLMATTPRVWCGKRHFVRTPSSGGDQQGGHGAALLLGCEKSHDLREFDGKKRTCRTVLALAKSKRL